MQTPHTREILRFPTSPPLSPDARAGRPFAQPAAPPDESYEMRIGSGHHEREQKGRGARPRPFLMNAMRIPVTGAGGRCDR